MTESQLSRRGFLIRSSVVAGAAIGAPAFLTACSSTSSSGDVLGDAKKKGYIKIGIAGEIPYGYTKNGKVTGEAPEVARAIFKKLGVADLHATQVDFDSLIPSLNAKHFDMVCAGMDITPERCGQAVFSEPDYQAPVAFLVPKGNPKGIANFADVKKTGVTLAAEKATVEIGYATANGVSKGKITQYASPAEMLAAVKSGRAYAAMLTDISLRSLLKQNPTASVEVTPGFRPTVNGHKISEVGGFVFRKGEDKLVDAFNKQLKAMHESGEWLKIAKPFGFSQSNIPAADVTTKKLCAGS